MGRNPQISNLINDLEVVAFEYNLKNILDNLNSVNRILILILKSEIQKTAKARNTFLNKNNKDN